MSDDLLPDTDVTHRPEELLLELLHEMRNPAILITGFSDVLLSEIEEPLTAVQRQHVEAINRYALELVNLRQHYFEKSKTLFVKPKSIT